MAIRDPYVVGTSSFDVEETRVANGATLTPSTSAVKALTGIRPGPSNPGAVTASGTPDAFSHVAPFQAFIQSTRSANGGVYTFTSDSIFDVNHLGGTYGSPANSTNPRNDLVIAHVPDTYYADANSTPIIRPVIGTPSGSPADPNLSAYPDAVVLARVRIPANATTVTNANITDLRPPHTVALGGVLPTNTATTRNALTGLYDGLVAYRRDRNWIETYDGAAWRVEGPPVVSSVADLSAITNPHTGLLATNTGDGLTYRYTGSAWVPHGLWRASTELASPAASIAFAVPSTLKNLTIRWTARSTVSAATDVLYLRINNDSTNLNYLHQLHQVINASPAHSANASGTDKWFIGNIAAALGTANCFAAGTIDIQGWDAPHQTLNAVWRSEAYVDTNLQAYMCAGGGWFRGSGPYATIQLFPTTGNNFAADTRVDVYGFE